MLWFIYTLLAFCYAIALHTIKYDAHALAFFSIVVFWPVHLMIVIFIRILEPAPLR